MTPTYTATLEEVIRQAQRLLMHRDGSGLLTLWGEFPGDVQAQAVRDALVRVVGADVGRRN